MGKSRDWDELQYTWTEWRRKSGRDMRDLYEQMAELTNEAARYNSEENQYFFVEKLLTNHEQTLPVQPTIGHFHLNHQILDAMPKMYG